jgi:hypothetical protein
MITTRKTDYFRKRTVKFILCTAVLTVICLNSFPQYKKNAVILDLAGKSLYYFDIAYERYLVESFHLGAGAGLAGISHMYINEEEKELDLNLRFPVYCGYSFGKRRHHAIAETGITLDCINCFSGSSDISVWPFISIGYEYRGSKIIIRVPVYAIYVGHNEWWPPVWPWAGVSIGVPF